MKDRKIEILTELVYHYAVIVAAHENYKENFQEENIRETKKKFEEHKAYLVRALSDENPDRPGKDIIEEVQSLCDLAVLKAYKRWIRESEKMLDSFNS